MKWLMERIDNSIATTAGDFYKAFGFRHVAGISLNGERAIAGPISLSYVILPPEHNIQLMDIGNLSYEDYVRMSTLIKNKSTDTRLSWATIHDIYKIGKTRALDTAVLFLLAAVNEYNPISILITEGFQLDHSPVGLRKASTPVIHLPKTTGLVEVLTAANIVARAARESLMSKLDDEYPEYNWSNNMGYATPQHLESIKEHGISPYHRDLSNIKSLAEWRAFPNQKLQR
jgi:ribonuclease HII